MKLSVLLTDVESTVLSTFFDDKNINRIFLLKDFPIFQSSNFFFCEVITGIFIYTLSIITRYTWYIIYFLVN